MIVFKNDGEIDVRSISTFGISVKEGSNPIGFFGTGLKYAIAVLLREGHKVQIFSGTTEIDFALKHEEVRGQTFDFVTMAVDGAVPYEIGFTTELGKTWDLWMAYREIACNCKDESGDGTYENELPLPIAGSTQIIVMGDKFEGIFGNRNEYILEDQPWLSNPLMEVRRYEGSHFFYRNVRVMPFNKRTVYTYNCKASLDLTEDRTVKHQWYPAHYIAKFIMQSDDATFIRHVLTAKDDTVEHGLDYSGHSFTPSDTFLNTVANLVSDRLTQVNMSAVKVWRDATESRISPKEITLTKIQQISMDRALDFCAKIGFDIRDAYPIKVVESLGSGTLGLAEDETIFIAERVFQIGGAKQLASTLIEEYLHLRHGWKDMTRELQNFLFEKMVSIGEELVGEPL